MIQPDPISIFGVELYFGFLILGSLITGLVWIANAFLAGRLFYRRDNFMLSIGHYMTIGTLILMDFIIFAGITFQLDRVIFRALLAFLMGFQMVGAISMAIALLRFRKEREK